VTSVHTRLDEGNEPWAEYEKSRVMLTAAMKKLGFARR
jgi:bifunctional non-homologous end joining protein LigD